LNGFFVSDERAKRDQFGLLSLDDGTEQRLVEQVELLAASLSFALQQEIAA
jgi:FMN reductase